jgi:hypothetical protein
MCSSTSGCRSPVAARPRDAKSTTVIGFLQDVTDLRTAFLIVSVFILIGGGLWVLGAKRLDDDTARAEGTDGALTPPG